jgi:TRAP transporter TAXI family solute receptor
VLSGLRRRRWLIAGILIAATAVAGYSLSGPSPPRRIRLATGQPGGMYDAFGAQYAARLGRIGLRTVIVPSSGSLDNLRSLRRREVDVAFVQSGTYPLVEDPEDHLRGIAAIYLEPLWVFHRGGLALRSLSELAGRRVSVGLPGSGTEAVATALLQAHGIDPKGSDIERLNNGVARLRLEQGTLHAAFFVTGYGDPNVMSLLGRGDIRLLSFHRETAYARKFPALTPVRLPEGLLDLRHNLPAEDKTLLAPAALLVCRADLHPRVVEQILKVAQTVHAGGSLLDPPHRFPTREGVDMPLHDAAEVYLTQGESFLSRTLPYPLLRWTLILRVLVVSLILWIPLMRFLPEVAGWRIDRRFARLYAGLRNAERRLEAARDPGELRVSLAALDRLALEAQPLCDRVPAGRQHDVYNWRVHVAFVRSQALARLAALESAPPSALEARSDRRDQIR